MFYLPNQIRVKNFERFVETELSKPLQRIPNGCRRPSFAERTETLLFESNWETSPDITIFGRIDLKS